MNNDRLSKVEYREEIECIVRDAMREAGCDKARAHGLVWEAVDGHSWVNYHPLKVLEHGSDPSNYLIYTDADLNALFNEGGFAKVAQTLAFCAMLSDVKERLYELFEEEEDEEA